MGSQRNGVRPNLLTYYVDKPRGLWYPVCMARPLRIEGAGLWHHVMCRGNGGQLVFGDSQDYHAFLKRLGELAASFHVEVHAYALMTNHVHLLVVPHAPEGLARGIGLANMSYTQHVNRKYQRSGRIWQNRFFSSVVKTERYFLAVARYI